MMHRLNIVLAQQNIWDFDEFAAQCRAQGKPVLPLAEWAQKIGMLQAARVRYPDMTPWDAYMNLINNGGEGYDPPTDSGGNVMPCGSCGGGTVR